MYQKRTAFGLFCAVFLMMIGVGMIVAVMPRFYIDMSGSPHTVGSLAAAFAITYLIVQLVIGRLADRYGFRLFLIAGYFICSLAGLCFYLSADALMLIFGRLVQGIGEAPVWSLAPMILAAQDPVKAGRTIGGYNAALHVGLALGPGLGLLSMSVMPDDSVFAIFAVLCLSGGLILIATLNADMPVQEGKQSQQSRRSMLPIFSSNRKLLSILLGAGLYGAGYGSFLTVIPAYLQLVKDFSHIGIGIFFSVFYVAIGLTALLTGPLSDRYGQRGFMTGGMIVAAIGIAFIPALHGGFLSGFLIISVLALGIFGISSLSFLHEMAPAGHKGTFAGCYFLFWGLGMFCGPLMIGGMDALTEPGTGLQSYGVIMGLYVFILHKGLFGMEDPGMN